MMRHGYLLILMVSLLVVRAMSAQTRIAVITDIHVIGPGLVVKDGKAWQSTLAGERKMLDKSQEIFDGLITKFRAQKPNLLLVTGDLTKDGERLSHQYVKDGLDKLAAVGVKVFVIPGNHDLGTANAKIFEGDKTEMAETIDEDGFRAMYINYGYGTTSIVDSMSLSYACEPVKGLTLIGIDSHSGSLSGMTLDWVCRQAEEARSKGHQVIAMMHHPLFPHFNNAELYISTSTISNYENVRNRLSDAGIHIILTGHFHTSDIAKDWNADLSHEIYDINTGSTISYPCDYRMLTLSADLSKMTISTGHIDTLPSDAVFGKTSKARLYDGIYANAYQTLASRFTFSEDEKKQLADIAARTFIVHAEGNEGSKAHAESVEQIYYDINRISGGDNLLIKMAVAYLKPTFESVLKDISNYDDPDREDCTDDLTLSITMSAK